ncbi:class D sortase [Halobacillus salinarum]|uniref:Class D sortase n=1 Tax=Halobacillus salinarum TaxID=2932257 RepID=A0ABY4EJ89_9BACI|nr:class D sortase [Halobacillus salinarum]UOQ44541.1 class D sortase [Halobacillus salinarum]
MKWLALLIMLAGIGILIFPSAENYYASYKKNQLMEQFENGNSPPPPGSMTKDSFQALQQVLEEGDSSISVSSPSSSYVLGILEIPSIEVKQPILEGATSQNLKYGVGHLTNTASLGEKGNAALAGHHSYQSGKLFNRLSEVKKGDVLTVTLTHKKLTYKVTDTFLVKPNDRSVLSQSYTKPVITLITCNTAEHPTHRLIVRAALIPSKNG